MIRLQVVPSARLDQDVEAHLAMLEQLPRVQVSTHPRPVTNELALILRDAMRLRRSDEVDVLVTAGEPALVAALLTWRGPHVHLPVGLLTRVEERLLRWRGSSRPTLTVFSSRLACADAARRGVDRSRLRTIRPAPPAVYATRDEIRKSLGIAPNATCVLVSGPIRHVGDQHLTLWAAGILAFRDPTWRVLIHPGNQHDYVRRYIKTTSQPGVTVLCGQCSASELAVAADVAMVDPTSVPSLVSLASAVEHRVPLVASPQMWAAEQLMHLPATLVDDTKQRRWAKAVIETLERTSGEDRREQTPRSLTDSKTLVHDWLEALHEVCGTTRAQVA